MRGGDGGKGKGKSVFSFDEKLRHCSAARYSTPGYLPWRTLFEQPVARGLSRPGYFVRREEVDGERAGAVVMDVFLRDCEVDGGRSITMDSSSRTRIPRGNGKPSLSSVPEGALLLHRSPEATVVPEVIEKTGDRLLGDPAAPTVDPVEGVMIQPQQESSQQVAVVPQVDIVEVPEVGAVVPDTYRTTVLPDEYSTAMYFYMLSSSGTSGTTAVVPELHPVPDEELQQSPEATLVDIGGRKDRPDSADSAEESQAGQVDEDMVVPEDHRTGSGRNDTGGVVPATANRVPATANAEKDFTVISQGVVNQAQETCKVSSASGEKGGVELVLPDSAEETLPAWSPEETTAVPAHESSSPEAATAVPAHESSSPEAATAVPAHESSSPEAATTVPDHEETADEGTIGAPPDENNKPIWNSVDVAFIWADGDGEEEEEEDWGWAYGEEKDWVDFENVAATPETSLGVAPTNLQAAVKDLPTAVDPPTGAANEEHDVAQESAPSGQRQFGCSSSTATAQNNYQVDTRTPSTDALQHVTWCSQGSSSCDNACTTWGSCTNAFFVDPLALQLTFAALLGQQEGLVHTITTDDDDEQQRHVIPFTSASIPVIVYVKQHGSSLKTVPKSPSYHDRYVVSKREEPEREEWVPKREEWAASSGNKDTETNWKQTRYDGFLL